MQTMRSPGRRARRRATSKIRRDVAAPSPIQLPGEALAQLRKAVTRGCQPGGRLAWASRKEASNTAVAALRDLGASAVPGDAELVYFPLITEDRVDLVLVWTVPLRAPGQGAWTAGYEPLAARLDAAGDDLAARQRAVLDRSADLRPLLSEDLLRTLPVPEQTTGSPP